MDKFGMQIPINPPKIDFDLNTITQSILVKSVEDIDDAIVAEIYKIAREEDVTTLVVLDKKRIKQALEKATAKKAKLVSGYRTIETCPTCDHELIYSSKYCDQCGQKVIWNHTEDD